MLLLSRREHEEVVIVMPDGRHVVIEVMDISSYRQQVRLGINAPQDVRIWRREILPTADHQDGG